ncbi:dsDNA-specific endonuclease/ATPase MutS2 [Cytobacillus horneckiae]
MNKQTFDVLGFQEILEDISEFAKTSKGKESIKSIQPQQNKRKIEGMLEEVK